ncbi:cell wall-binding repeat-containing protein [Rossellomorea aquimaris]|uniref:cell wall-binding repeat-containing protein n=1 Tax=Rossellomorea aquimaris TaxID=189382 RepID=UPI001CD74F04|nr:cell wall-binding repeat-containing protein [Rossellomorea aquimaris]MCA1060808.1 cell wall-binding repeat-containing protein [Rossellomorea aquimaris]
MKSTIKKIGFSLAVVMLTSSLCKSGEGKAYAAEFQNPSPIELNKMLTEAALAQDVPPEIVKALAEKESDWKQFENGEPFISSDNGIGIMQVTTTEGYDVDRLKTDIRYNIQAGIEILNKKWNQGKSGLSNWTSSSIPTVGENERDTLENWYFALLAYNGKKQVNSPIYMSNGNRNYSSYQDEVYKKLTNGNPGIFDRVNIPFTTSDFTYSGSPDYNLLFNTKHFEVEGRSHTTKHRFHSGDLVVSAEASPFRKSPSSGSEQVGKLPVGQTEVLEVLNDFEYDQSNNKANHFVWYNVERESNIEKAYVSSSELTRIGKRLSGKERFDTAVKISQEGWNTSKTVVLAQGYNFPDALTGGPLAFKHDAPLLLTEKNRLTGVTKEEIKRLHATNVIILGGTGAVGTEVADALNQMNISVKRVGGEDRFETAQLIAREVNANASKAVIAYGYNYPDALSVAPYASKNAVPILLTNTNDVPGATMKALLGVEERIVVGGEAAVSSAVMKKMEADQRISGVDRYETSIGVAKTLPMGNQSNNVLVASGSNFPDALAGSVLAAKKDAPLILSNPEELPVPVKTFITESEYKQYYLMGGYKALNVEGELGKVYKKLFY